MKRKKISIWLLVCILSFSGFLLSYEELAAASATISLTEPKEVVKSGDTFTVIVVVQSSASISNVETFVSFDKDMVTFKSGGLYATSGDGIVMVKDWDSSDESTRKKYPLTFQAKKDGECKFETSKNASVYDASTKETMSVSCVNLSFQIGETEKDTTETIENPEVKEQTTEKGTAPILETLTVSDGILAPLFEPNTYKYETEVDSTVDKLAILAIPKNKGDKVSIEGNENLKEGVSHVTITLTSSLGRTKEYTIAVTKNNADSLAVPKEEQIRGGLHCIEEDGTLTLTQSVLLTIKTPDKKNIPSNYEETSLRIDGIAVPAYMKSNDLNTNIYFIYGTDQYDNIGFYQYNRLTKIIEPITDETKSTVKSSETTEPLERDFQLVAIVIIIIILGIICVVLSVVLALQILKKRQADTEEDEPFRDLKY